MTPLGGADWPPFKSRSSSRFRLLPRRGSFLDRRRPAVLTRFGWHLLLGISAALVVGAALAFAV
jgi:hypothetical protein